MLIELVMAGALAQGTINRDIYTADPTPVFKTYATDDIKTGGDFVMPMKTFKYDDHSVNIIVPDPTYIDVPKKAIPLIYCWTDKEGHQDVGTYDAIPLECRP